MIMIERCIVDTNTMGIILVGDYVKIITEFNSCLKGQVTSIDKDGIEINERERIIAERYEQVKVITKITKEDVFK